MAKVDKETRRIYDDNDPYLQTEEAKQKEFADRYSSSIMILDASKSQIGKKMGFENNGMYAIKVK
jgi:RNA polymerase subunit RPABC4/transcription elongation factor Spt4